MKVGYPRSHSGRNALAYPLNGGLFGLQAPPVGVIPKLGRCLVPLLTSDAWPLCVKSRRTPRDPFLLFHLITRSVCWCFIQYRHQRALVERAMKVWVTVLRHKGKRLPEEKWSVVQADVSIARVEGVSVASACQLHITPGIRLLPDLTHPCCAALGATAIASGASSDCLTTRSCARNGCATT